MKMPEQKPAGWGLCFGPAWQTSISDLLGLARAAENAGFDRIATGEYRSDAITWTALLAGATQNVHLATTIASIALRHPTVVGEGIAALRDVHGDRIELGLGVSHSSLVTEDLGLPQPTLGNLESYVTAVRSVLRGQPWEDDHYRVPTHARSRILTDPGPILVSVLGERAASRAAHYADGVILTWSPVDWTRKISTIIRDIDAERDRKTEIWVVVPTFPTAEMQTAVEACIRHLRPYLNLPAYRKMLEKSLGDPERVSRASSPDITNRELASALGRDTIECLAALGDRDNVTAMIRATREAGADAVILYPLDTGSGWRAAVERTITDISPSG